jgi:hypothetical protein
MSLSTQPPESDLLVPLPGEGDDWDPHTVHTHYFGFTVPEAEIGVFLYIRYMPYFPLCQGGVLAFQGMNNLAVTEAAYHDYLISMPWPEIEGTSSSRASARCSATGARMARRRSTSRPTR